MTKNVKISASPCILDSKQRKTEWKNKRTNEGIDSTLSVVIYFISLNLIYFLTSIGLMGLVMNITSDCLNFVFSISSQSLFMALFTIILNKSLQFL